MFGEEAFDPEKYKEEMERAKYEAEMKAAAEEQAKMANAQSLSASSEKTGREKRIREGKNDKVFKDIAKPTKDLSSILAQRLAAMEALKVKPNDPDALSELYEAQKQVTIWAESKNKRIPRVLFQEIFLPSLLSSIRGLI